MHQPDACLDPESKWGLRCNDLKMLYRVAVTSLTEYDTHLGIRHRDTHLFVVVWATQQNSTCTSHFLFFLYLLYRPTISYIVACSCWGRTNVTVASCKSVRFRSWIWYLHYSCSLRDFSSSVRFWVVVQDRRWWIFPGFRCGCACD